ncbi:hypothetical protein WJX79_001937 [Trebouxia sp. C0005]
MPITHVLQNNKEWAKKMILEKPDYFSNLAHQQAPEYLWIGCSDSRVPANQILGLAPVAVLKVKHIIVCGHYNCGAVRGALTMSGKTKMLTNLWISDIKETRNKHAEALGKLEGDAQMNRLTELNAIRQVFNVCSSPLVQSAWDQGQTLSVHGLAYAVGDGLLKELTQPITGYSSLAKAAEASDFPTDSEAVWEDRDLQKNITDSFKANMFFEQRQAKAKTDGQD